jgi:hypothetical protein
MMSREKLPNDLLWEGKHASELALFSFADGEESSLSNEVVLHLHTCNECVMRLGETALVTRGVTHAVQSVKPWLPPSLVAASGASARTVTKKRATQPIPWAAIGAALGLTVVGAAPTMMALPHRLGALAVSLLHAAPVMSRSGVQVFAHGLGAGWTQAMGVSAALLIATGFLITRLLPRPRLA